MSEQITIGYVNADDMWRHPYCLEHKPNGKRIETITVPPLAEHLEITCWRCGRDLQAAPQGGASSLRLLRSKTMYALYMIKGTWLYCSRECLEADNPYAERNDLGNIDSSEYFDKYDAAEFLSDRGWTNNKCDKCGDALTTEDDVRAALDLREWRKGN